MQSMITAVLNSYLSDVHAIDENPRHAKSGPFLVDVWAVISSRGVCGPVVLHADGPQVVLHHKNAWQLVERRHVEALIELACGEIRCYFALPEVHAEG